MATHKVGLAGVESGHQLNQGDEVDRGDSLAATLLLLLAVVLGGGGRLTWVVFPQENQQGIGRLALHDFDHRVVDGVLVLLEPSSDVVGHDSGVVGDGEVGVLVSLGLGLQEDGKLTQGGLEFFLEGLVCRLGEQRLLLEDGPDTHRLLKHDDGGGQVHAEVNHHPVNSLAHVFLLLYENMWWLKNCCSFSLTKLMEICSKPLYSKISKPAMSSTAQKLAFFMVGSIRVSLHLMISHLKILSKMARAIPPVAMVACSQV